MESFERLKGMVFGLATGDALGVPVEFSKRESCRENPVTGMRGFGTHTQPAGTWSDDASMTFCTMEAMLGDYHPELLRDYFLRWMQQGFWTPHGIVFDKGLATTAALQRLASGTPAVLAGGNDEMSNGNGSLMRMAPLAWHPEKEDAAFFHLIREASSVTHRHPRSVMACHFYLLLLRNLFRNEPAQAWEEVRTNWPSQMEKLWPEAAPELAAFERILRPDFVSLSEDEIQSGGYVMHSLEASVWCLLNSNSYAEAVLKAVNLGGDTDTTGAICGALAGTVYGYSGIPEEWRRMLARTTEIEELSSRFHQKFAGHEVE